MRAPKVRDDHGVSLRIAAEKVNVPHGEPAVISAVFENRTAKHITLPTFDPWDGFHQALGYGRPTIDSWSFTRVSVEPLREERGDWAPGRVGGGWVEIPPNSETSYTVDLQDVHTCPRKLPVGEYTVWVEYEALNGWPGMARDWYLVSNAIRIRIVLAPKDTKSPRK